MSDANRPLSRWSTSLSMGTKLPGSTQPIPTLVATRRKFIRPTTHNGSTFAQRMAKTKRDIEELFKLYYSNSIKFDTFEQQIVTGTRIPSARASPLIQSHFTESSSSVFNSQHCVSRELLETVEAHIAESQTNQKPNTPEPVIRRSLQVRLDPPAETIVSMPANWHLIESDQREEFDESTLVKSLTSLDDLATDSLEPQHLKRYRCMYSHRPSSSKSSMSTYPPVPPPSLLLLNTPRDTTQTSQSSFVTSNSNERVMPSPAVTGKAVIVRARSPTKPSLQRQQQRPRSSVVVTGRVSPVQPTNRRSGALIQPEPPNYLGAQRVVSIPSKCSRYVLVSLPHVSPRYKTPTYRERLLLPERFPTLFQNIVHSQEHSAQHP